MGLLLSILLVCVGAAELLAFYQTCTRTLRNTSSQTDLSDFTLNLRKNVDNLPVRESAVITDLTATQNTLSICSEAIELEVPRRITRSRSSSPRKLLLTEEGTSSPRKFKVTDEISIGDEALLPQFLVEEKHPVGAEAPQRHFVVKEPPRSPIPLPRQFIVTSDAELPPGDGVFRRSASPYPNLNPAPRNSVCSELLDNPTISVVEVDEDNILSESGTPEKVELLAESQHGSTEFWNNKLLVVTPKRSRSRTPDRNRRSVSPNELDRRKSKSVEVFNLGVDPTSEFLDGLDGVAGGRKSRRRTKPRKDHTAKTLTEAANILQDQGDVPKSADPFWVNQ